MTISAIKHMARGYLPDTSINSKNVMNLLENYHINEYSEIQITTKIAIDILSKLNEHKDDFRYKFNFFFILNASISKNHTLLIDLKDFLKSKKVPLDHLSEFLPQAAFNKFFGVVELLLSTDLQLNEIQKGRTLKYLAKFACTDLILTLLEKGVYINFKSELGQTALMEAVQDKHTDTILALLKKGADVNIKDHYGKTALIYAVERDYTEIVFALLEKGADINIKDEDGKTAVMFAVQYGLIDMALILLEKGANLNFKDEGLKPAIEHRVATVLSILDKMGIDIFENSKLTTQKDSEIAELFDQISDDKLIDYVCSKLSPFLNIEKDELKLALNGGTKITNTKKIARLSETLFQNIIDYKDNKSDKTQKALILYPLEDNFFSPAFSFKSKIRHIQKVYNHYHVTAKFPTDVEEFEEYACKLEKYDLIMILAHGDPSKITFTQNFVLDNDTVKKLSNNKTFFSLKKEPNASVILFSCEVGKGEDSIAYDIAKLALDQFVYFSDKRVTDFELKKNKNHLRVKLFAKGQAATKKIRITRNSLKSTEAMDIEKQHKKLNKDIEKLAGKRKDRDLTKKSSKKKKTQHRAKKR